LVVIAPVGGVVALLIAVVIVEVGVPWENLNIPFFHVSNVRSLVYIATKHLKIIYLYLYKKIS
jgi:hypothetical protein